MFFFEGIEFSCREFLSLFFDATCFSVQLVSAQELSAFFYRFRSLVLMLI